MNNITVPIQKEHLNNIDTLIKDGFFDNRSQFIRTAIKRMLEEKEIEEIKEASHRASMGEVFEGDIDELISKHA